MANRLISSGISNNAVNPLSTSATYAYNAQGQRVTRVEDEVITHFYYTGSALLFTTVNEYVLQTQNILDPSGTIVASKRFEGQAETEQDPYADDYFFYRYDIRGSVTNIVDGTGAVVKSYDYDEFGVTTSTGDAFFNEVTFTGSVADASGLLYMNARYYNPTTARFLSQDTYTGSASDPWTQHLYAYCNNNPVNMVDPTGHMAGRSCTVNINDGGGGLSSYELMERSVTPEPTPNPWATPLPQPGPKPEILTEGQKEEYLTQFINIWESEHNVCLYVSMDEAVANWALEASSLNQDYEYYAGIFSVTCMKDTFYYMGATHRGTETGVVKPFLSEYLRASPIGSSMVGMAHTHPSVPEGVHNDFPSFEDVLLLGLPGIQEVFLAPTSFCRQSPQISVIRVSQPSDYYHGHINEEFYCKHLQAFISDPFHYWVLGGRNDIR